VSGTDGTGSRRLDDPGRHPDDALLGSILGRRFSAWKGFLAIIDGLPPVRAEWRYYTDGKSWLFKVTEKEKTICWVSARDGLFTVTFYMASRHGTAVENAGIDSGLVRAWRAGGRGGEGGRGEARGTAGADRAGSKIRPITVEVRSRAQLADVRRLVDLKRGLR
jgi:hypothetical protein